MRYRLSHKYIRGKGIEIGGKHYPLPVEPGVEVTHVDLMSKEDLAKHSDIPPNFQGDIVVDDAERLEKFASRSLDFIIANHVLEHCRSPLSALKVWHDRLKPGGIVYAAIPEKNFTFDKPRPLTPFSHLLQDLINAPNTDDEAHYRDWISTIDKKTGDELEVAVKRAVETKANIHFHVWDAIAMGEIFEWTYKWGLFDRLDLGNNGAELIWILRKR